ncbi:2OG-Fe(II) oxygenase [Vibrio neptunius]|uniref:2OG-Fe(II) oxygenase n=1 Tax=Vibrio neptunius TaxID=170651 RepID=UPI0005F9B615|nr:2OG-Fe(II) oxygenase [Vibrio neptunius]KJY86190.1 2OG-Fe(II) oxygenase [Vibrio neptunius]
MDRAKLSKIISKKLEDNLPELKSLYQNSAHEIGYFYIDDLLPDEIVKEIYSCFPKPETMKLKKTLREYKYIAAQMDQYNPILEEAIYAFQDKKVVELVKEITSFDGELTPDEHLYAGGISLMGEGQYLNPHLDNSHEKDRNKWRVFNLLFYTTPDWVVDNGGNLELWPNGVDDQQITIESKFNRLVVMATHNHSWHSVSPIQTNNIRTCVSNYYFSDSSMKPTDTFHVTTFRGRPEQKVVDKLLMIDGKIRQSIRKIAPQGIVKTKHLYKKNK